MIFQNVEIFIVFFISNYFFWKLLLQYDQLIFEQKLLKLGSIWVKKMTTYSMLTSGLTTGMLSRILCLLRCLKMSSLSLEVKLHGCWVIWSISRHLYKTSWLEVELRHLKYQSFDYLHTFSLKNHKYLGWTSFQWAKLPAWSANSIQHIPQVFKAKGTKRFRPRFDVPFFPDFLSPLADCKWIYYHHILLLDN